MVLASSYHHFCRVCFRKEYSPFPPGDDSCVPDSQFGSHDHDSLSAHFSYNRYGHGQKNKVIPPAGDMEETSGISWSGSLPVIRIFLQLTF